MIDIKVGVNRVTPLNSPEDTLIWREEMKMKLYKVWVEDKSLFTNIYLNIIFTIYLVDDKRKDLDANNIILIHIEHYIPFLK